MNKQDFQELFEEQLTELNNFEAEIKKIKELINLLIENFDLLKDDVTDEQIGEVSSDIKIKSIKLNALIKELLSDSKKLEAFLHEIKLLKRKREKKLSKDKTLTKKDYEELLQKLQLQKLLDNKKLEIEKEKEREKYKNYPIRKIGKNNPYNFEF